ncbi:DNA repair protein RAD4, partial [Tanacetum coccineum]
FLKETPRTAVNPVNKVRQQMIEQIDLWAAQSLEGSRGSGLIYIGIRNERGQAYVWPEKCLSPGTAQLGFQRIWSIAKKLKINYAYVMVGFEFRNGRSSYIYNVIVVCTKFKYAILEVYAEEDV